MRSVLAAALMAAAMTMVTSHAVAQSRDSLTQIVVPFASGGSGDILARLLGQFLTDKHGRTVVIDTKPGANGIIGMQAAMNAAADGRTLVIASTSTFAANPSLFSKLPYDSERDFSLVAVVGTGGSYMLVRPGSHKSVADFIADAKSKPGTMNYGHFNATSQVSGALFAEMAGINLTPVPYKQIGNAIADLMGGQTHVLFVDTTAGDSYVAAGTLKALGVTQAERLSRYPDLPAIAETLPGYDVIGFIGVAVRSAVPEAEKLAVNGMINGAISDPPIRKRIEEFGFVPRILKLEDCLAFAKSEQKKWQGYIATARIPMQ